MRVGLGPPGVDAATDHDDLVRVVIESLEQVRLGERDGAYHRAGRDGRAAVVMFLDPRLSYLGAAANEPVKGVAERVARHSDLPGRPRFGRGAGLKPGDDIGENSVREFRVARQKHVLSLGAEPPAGRLALGDVSGGSAPEYQIVRLFPPQNRIRPGWHTPYRGCDRAPRSRFRSQSQKA